VTADNYIVQEMPIVGLILQSLCTIPTEGGPVLRMLRPDTPLLPDFSQGFGELYFSEVLPGKVKAWKRHRRQTQLFAVPCGLLELVFFDNRPGSATDQVLFHTLLGRPEHYALLRIPPMVWYGFRARGDQPALICNFADMPHDPAECERLPADSPAIPWLWKEQR